MENCGCIGIPSMGNGFAESTYIAMFGPLQSKDAAPRHESYSPGLHRGFGCPSSEPPVDEHQP